MSNVSDIIDSVIQSGYMTSVDVYRVLGGDPAAKRYILKHHLDEELEMHLYVTIGYDPMIHRMNVDDKGNISF
jgi:hypothetical protein